MHKYHASILINQRGNNMKKTQWFDGYIKPVRKGFYERKYDLPKFIDVTPDYWDGREWIFVDCKGNKRGYSGVQDRQWRGLTKNAKGK